MIVTVLLQSLMVLLQSGKFFLEFRALNPSPYRQGVQAGLGLGDGENLGADDLDHPQLARPVLVKLEAAVGLGLSKELGHGGVPLETSGRSSV